MTMGTKIKGREADPQWTGKERWKEREQPQSSEEAERQETGIQVKRQSQSHRWRDDKMERKADGD